MFPFSANVYVNNALDLLWHLFARSSQPQGIDLHKTPLVLESVPDEPSSLFALLIGINKYKSARIRDLGGAVSDVEAMKIYLETSLGVPSSNIKTLLDEDATRAAIITSLRALKTNNNIKPLSPFHQSGDAILIFYAGHGGTAEAPIGWEAGGPNIQVLVAYDSDTICGDNGHTINGIPDRTIGVLLEEIAKAKGNNITVILDCCYAASLTRNPSRVVRGVSIPMELAPDLDREIWSRKRGTSVPSDTFMSGMSSHVLLAACGTEEYSYEQVHNGVARGEFSKGLLDTLIKVGADKVSYTELIQRVPCMLNPIILSQNPHCAGRNKDRICFNSKAPSQGRHLYLVRKTDDQYIMEAGAAHGITDGAKFAVYVDRDSVSTKAPLAILIASQPRVFSTVLLASPDSPGFIIENQAYALQIGAGKKEDLCIHVEMDDRLVCVFQALVKNMEESDPLHPKIMLVEKERAELSIAFENKEILFTILDPLITAYGLNQISHGIVPRDDSGPTVDDIQPTIRAAAHYFWHLHRSGNAYALQHKVEIEFLKLKRVREKHDGIHMTIWQPYGPNLINEGIVDIVVDDVTVYGIKITSKFNSPLYPSLFFFDSSDMTISSYFEPPIASGKVDPPLLPNKTIAIGYGAEGARPFRYTLSGKQNIDVGFLKLFLSTEQVDLSSIPQHPPFGARKKAGRKSSRLEETSRELWHTLLLTVVQRRHASS